jgi:phenylalanyl-tRNA synthetase beta chain
MKVSLNWLKEYINIDLSAEEVGDILTDIGLEVEGMEKVESLPGGLKGVVVGHVLECGQHPNADRLSLTKVDVGSEAGGLLQIVCGAPNVAKGQKVMVATVGTTLHPIGSDEPLTLKKGKIRGEVSEGMICAVDELGIGTDHSGILVLPLETEVGTLASDYFNVETDYVYEIGLTPNRSDATNHLGVAKDLAAYLQINHAYEDGVKLPDITAFEADDTSLPVEVVVENQEACPRYAGLTLKNITVKESPDWLKTRLRAIGVRPINNMVDATNFILHELGQPLHAFDLAHVTGNKIIVKTLPAGSKFTTLDEVERELHEEDLMICNGEEAGMCIGGVFGGIQSGVTETTTEIFLESAHFHPKWIRRTSMRHNLRTDAAKVFEKGSDPNIAVYALKRAALLMKELGEGEIASEITDLYPEPVQKTEVTVNYEHVNRLIGIDIPREEIHKILGALEMDLLGQTEEGFIVAIPTNKSDVTREADVIEEILRIYGYNKVPIPSQVKTGLNVAEKPDPNELRDAIGNLLAANGFNEIMSLSLSQSRYYTDVLSGLPTDNFVYINNTSTVQLDIMRPDMLVSGLETVLHNQNRQQADLKLFEFGRTYQKEDKIKEEEHLSLFITGGRYPESWIAQRAGNSDIYTLKAMINHIMARLGLSGYQESEIKDEVFAYGMKYHRGPNTLVEFGKVNPKQVKAMDIKGEVFYADIYWGAILKAVRKHKIEYQELNKYPTVRRDLALVIDNSVKFSDIVAIARKHGKKLIRDINLFDVYENEEQLGSGKKSYAVSFIFEDITKTLKDKEVDKVVNKLIAEYESKLGASIRR